MALRFHPKRGTIITCNFDQGVKAPEMVKRRPVVVLSPQIKGRQNLCTVVALSTTEPDVVHDYHCKITPMRPYPAPFDAGTMWVKGDMVYAAGFHRLDLIRSGKDYHGKRQYRTEVLPPNNMRRIEQCVLHGMGLGRLIAT